jgi:hypothetical protein
LKRGSNIEASVAFSSVWPNLSSSAHVKVKKKWLEVKFSDKAKHISRLWQTALFAEMFTSTGHEKVSANYCKIQTILRSCLAQFSQHRLPSGCLNVHPQRHHAFVLKVCKFCVLFINLVFFIV